MKEFKKYVKTKESLQELQKAGLESMNLPDDIPKESDFDPNDVNYVKNLANKYKGKKNQLINDIVKLADQNRKDGKLKNTDLENFESRIAPMLNGEQKKMLKEIMGMIKK